MDETGFRDKCNNQLKSISSQYGDRHLLIDEWERSSIEKIQYKAKEFREELFNATTRQINRLSKRLEILTEQINHADELQDFTEMNIAWWKHSLSLIKSDLTSSIDFTIHIKQIDCYKTIQERFDRTSGDRVHIAEDGEVVVHHDLDEFEEIRGKNEYSSGCHTIRLRLEFLSFYNLYLGINSKQTPLQNNSYSVKSAYLWYSGNYMICNGLKKENHSNVPIEMHKYDTIILIFDCDKKKISMINERTQARHDLDVNIDQCPFPWQLHMNMHYVNESVRILPSSIVWS